MRIQPIINSNDYGNCKPRTFKGYINGHYYSDEIISKAKKALKNPHWRDELLRQKSNVIDDVASWHEGIQDQGGGFTRTMAAILSFGATEVVVDSIVAAGSAMNNASINKEINQIAKCLDDLRR